MNAQDLPHFNVAMNACAAVCLAAGFIAIRKGNQTVHKRFMIGAMVFSALFLGGYLTYHFTCDPKKYGGDFPWVYYPMLISHIGLAAVNLPLIIVTAVRAFRQRFDKHKRIARITLPIWSYVSVTGILVYLFLYT